MQEVRLAGGRRTRLAEETRLRPKPTVEVGGQADFLAHHQVVVALRGE